MDSRSDNFIGSMSTQKKKKYVYDSIVLFNWNVDLQNPFHHASLSDFRDEDILPHWISKHLGVNARISKLRGLSPCPNDVVSLFAKIELGKEYSNTIYIYKYVYV